MTKDKVGWLRTRSDGCGQGRSQHCCPLFGGGELESRSRHLWSVRQSRCKSDLRATIMGGGPSSTRDVKLLERSVEITTRSECVLSQPLSRGQHGDDRGGRLIEGVLCKVQQ